MTPPDITQMINYFQSEMRPPLVGFGQSWGATVLAMAASWNRRLFQVVILSEPVLENGWYHVRNSLETNLVSGGDAAPSIARRKRYFSNRSAVMDTVGRAKI